MFMKYGSTRTGAAIRGGKYKIKVKELTNKTILGWIRTTHKFTWIITQKNEAERSALREDLMGMRRICLLCTICTCRNSGVCG
jgi:hypothetical protein